MKAAEDERRIAEQEVEDERRIAEQATEDERRIAEKAAEAEQITKEVDKDAERKDAEESGGYCIYRKRIASFNRYLATLRQKKESEEEENAAKELNETEETIVLSDEEAEQIINKTPRNVTKRKRAVRPKSKFT